MLDVRNFLEISLSLKVYDPALYWYYVISLIKVCLKRIHSLIKHIKIKVRKVNLVWSANEGETFFLESLYWKLWRIFSFSLNKFHSFNCTIHCVFVTLLGVNLCKTSLIKIFWFGNNCLNKACKVLVLQEKNNRIPTLKLSFYVCWNYWSVSLNK